MDKTNIDDTWTLKMNNSITYERYVDNILNTILILIKFKYTI